MPTVTVRNLPDATHQALKLRASQQGRSIEAEIRFILESAVAPKVGLGSALAAIGRSLGGVELDVHQDKRAVEPANFR